MNISTLFAGQNSISSFILYPTSSFEFNFGEIENKEFFDITTNGNSLPIWSSSLITHSKSSFELPEEILSYKQDKEKMATSSTLKCYFNTADDENCFSHSIQGNKVIQSTLKCHFNTVGEINTFPHSTHENMTKCSTLKCHFNTADDKNHFSHSAQDKALK